LKLFRFILLPFALIYSIITDFRNLLFDKKILKSSGFDLPLINVGNLKIGGTGKSPHVEYICNLLKTEFEIAILSRGYGRKSSGFKKVNLNNKASEVGDEPLQFKTKFPEIDVNVCESRVDGVIEIIAENQNVDAIILDDAFQHRSIKAGLNILITEYSNLFSSDFILPLGRLRERRHSAKRADFIVVSKCPENISESEKSIISKSINKYTDKDILFSSIKYKQAYHLFDDSEIDLTIDEALFFSGIASSKNALEYLKTIFKKTHHKSFSDHFKYDENSISKILKDFDNIESKSKILLTTEKDAVKLKEFDILKKYPIFVLGIEIEFLGNDKDKFDKKITDYVRAN
jgi:tetraacyldisaccharide 4'-kinase